MKNGLGALDRALDMLNAYAVEDDIPINDPDLITAVVEDARVALDDVRTLIKVTRALPEASDVLDAIDRLTLSREGTRA